MFKSKRGLGIALIGDTIKQLLIAAVLVVVCYISMWGILRGAYFQKTVIAIDQSLVMNTLHAATGNVLLTYPQIPINLYYDLDEDQIVVYQKGDLLKLSSGFIASYVPRPKIVLNLSINQTKQLRFLKLGDYITLRENDSFNPNTEECPAITPKPELRHVVFMPKEITNTIIMKIIDNSLKEEFQKFELVNKIEKDILYDVLINISVYKDNPDSIKILIPFNSKQSRRLACLIANNLQEDFAEKLPKLNIPIIPSKEKFFEDKLKAKATLVIAIGENLINTLSIAPDIKSALDKYLQKGYI